MQPRFTLSGIHRSLKYTEYISPHIECDCHSLWIAGWLLAISCMPKCTPDSGATLAKTTRDVWSRILNSRILPFHFIWLKTTQCKIINKCHTEFVQSLTLNTAFQGYRIPRRNSNTECCQKSASHWRQFTDARRRQEVENQLWVIMCPCKQASRDGQPQDKNNYTTQKRKQAPDTCTDAKQYHVNFASVLFRGQRTRP